jgi:hypothetical protein
MTAPVATCMKCKARSEIREPRTVANPGPRPLTMGKCPICGSAVFAIGRREEASR